MARNVRRIEGVRISTALLTLLRRMAEGDRLIGQRTFPQDWTFTQLPRLAAERSAKSVPASLMDTLIRVRLAEEGEVVTVGNRSSSTFRLTERGHEAIAGRGFDSQDQQLTLLVGVAAQ